MSKLHKNEKGFGAVEGILIIVVVILLGAVGWFVYDRNHGKATTSSAPATSTTTPTVNTKSTVDYLTIKEWGVKVPQLPAGNKVSYQISDYDKNEADFVSSEQKAIGGSCGDFSFARYHIFQAASGYKSNDEIRQNQLNYAAENNLDIKIGSKTYYILGDMTGGDCTGTAKEGSTTSQKEVTANKDLLTSLKGLVKAD